MTPLGMIFQNEAKNAFIKKIRTTTHLSADINYSLEVNALTAYN